MVNDSVVKADFATKTCTRCSTFEVNQILYRHIMAAIHAQFKAKSVNRADLESFFHPVYLVETFSAAFDLISIEIPLECELIVSRNVLPPPWYIDAGHPA